MNLLSFSASHRDLDLDVLERLSAGATSVGRDLVAACPTVTGAVVLATCNRLEVYVETPDGARPDEIAAALTDAVASSGDIDPGAARDALRLRSADDATRHLFEVASGLDSMVVGEREIAGQVRRALTAAHAAGMTSTTLEQAFQFASRVSRRVEAATGLGSAGRSIVNVGLDLVAAAAPPWRQARVILIGTGSYAGASLAALRARGCDDVRVYSRSGRAEAFAAARGVDSIPVDGLVEALADADVVVSCSGRIGTVLDAAAVASARERATVLAEDRAHEPDAPARPLVLLDLALQRDVEADVADVEGVLLLDLATIRANAPQVGTEPVERAREVVADAVEEFSERLAARTVDLAVVDEIRALEELAHAEVVAGVAALGGQRLDAPARARAEKTLRQEVRARLHAEIQAAKAAVRAQVGSIA